MRGVPKDTGGLRPLSISSIFWRCGSTALLSKMSVWIDEWAPHELAGGLRGRCADSIHESLKESLERIWDSGEPLAGSKLDVEKFFGSCDLEQALAVVDRVGMPKEISELPESSTGIRNATSKWLGCVALARCTQRDPSCRGARGL